LNRAVEKAPLKAFANHLPILIATDDRLVTAAAAPDMANAIAIFHPQLSDYG